MVSATCMLRVDLYKYVVELTWSALTSGCVLLSETPTHKLGLESED